MDNYASAPLSITEIRSDKTGKANDWTPRDVLISTLRELDSGLISPDLLVVCFREPTKDDAGSYDMGFTQSGKDIHATAGVVMSVAMKLLGTLR